MSIYNKEIKRNFGLFLRNNLGSGIEKLLNLITVKEIEFPQFFLTVVCILVRHFRDSEETIHSAEIIPHMKAFGLFIELKQKKYFLTFRLIGFSES